MQGEESKANKKTCKDLIECSGNNKAQLLSLPDKARTRNCIFMVIEGNSMPNNSQRGNIENLKLLNNLKWGSEQDLQLLSHMTWKPKWQSACRDDQPVLLLGEDGDPRGLEDCDLHQSAVGLHRFAVVKGDDKQLRHRREEADEANEAETNVKP